MSNDRLQRPTNSFKKYDVGIAPRGEVEFLMRPDNTQNYYQKAVASSLRWEKILRKKFPRVAGVISFSFDWEESGHHRVAKLSVVVDASRPAAVAWAEDMLTHLPDRWK